MKGADFIVPANERVERAPLTMHMTCKRSQSFPFLQSLRVVLALREVKVLEQPTGIRWQKRECYHPNRVTVWVGWTPALAPEGTFDNAG